MLSSTTKNDITKNVIDKFASTRLSLNHLDQALRTIGIAYRDIDHLSNASRSSNNAGNLKGICEKMKEEELEKDLTLIAIVGIKDPVRKEVPGAI